MKRILRKLNPVRYRRRWCLWRNHPIAAWSPICISEYGPPKMVDGIIVEGDSYVVKAYRCSFHDTKPVVKFNN